MKMRIVDVIAKGMCCGSFKKCEALTTGGSCVCEMFDNKAAGVVSSLRGAGVTVPTEAEVEDRFKTQ